MSSWLTRFTFWTSFSILLGAFATPASAWPTTHGQPDNTGFADIPTAPAADARTIRNLGSFAPGAAPVIAPDGTLYIGNEQGKLMSFKPDGTPGWSRQLNRGEGILASPVVGADGSIYVIGVRRYRDSRVQPVVERRDATLHRFTPSGGWASQTPFPEHNGGGGTSAAPNLWRFNGQELIMVPAPYRREVDGGIDIRLLAFAPDGGLVADQRATSIVPETTGGAGIPTWLAPFCLVPPVPIVCNSSGFEPANQMLPPPPFPGLGLHTNPAGGTPWIVVSDHHQTLVGFTFSRNDGKFYEVFRLHDDKRILRSAPSFLPDQHSIVGTQDFKRDNNGKAEPVLTGGAILSGPNQAALGPLSGLQPIFAPATRLADGRTILLGADGQMSVLSGTQVTGKANVDWAAFGATASRTHLFVASPTALQTFDPATMTQLTRFAWSGGTSRAVIGPQGHVYAMAGGGLVVFPPRTMPSTASGGPVTGDWGFEGNPTNSPTQGMPKPATSNAQGQSYAPPLTANGNRLFACEELDGDNCGKGDHRAIAAAFCVKSGYSQAAEYDVDSKKTKAETLDGQYCSKKKCKVFEEIVCKM